MGFPTASSGSRLSGEVDSGDYETVAAPAVQHALDRHPKIRLIHVLDDRFTGYTAGGAWQDAMLGLAHPRSFDRIAVVTDRRASAGSSRLGGWSIPGSSSCSPTASARVRRRGPAKGSTQR